MGRHCSLTYLARYIMDWKLLATVGIPGAVVAGWFFAHWLTSRRELATRKREARIKALETAYMRIASSTNRDLTPESKEKFETFVAEIQLYGTPHQIQLMQQMVEAVKTGGDVSHDAILVDLRDTIRGQLELESVAGPVWWLRFDYAQPVPIEVGTNVPQLSKEEG